MSNNLVRGQDADSLLREVAETYKDLRSYYFAGETEVRMRAGRQTRTQTYRIQTAERFPTHFSVTLGGEEPFAFVADGEQTWVYDGVLKEYLHRSWVLRPGKEREEVPDLLATYKRLGEGPVQAKIVGDTLHTTSDREIPAVLLDVVPQVSASLQESVSFRLWVDPASYLVLREDLTRYIPNSPYGGPLTITQVTDYEIAAVGEAVPDSAFVFEPPSDASLVRDLDRFRRLPKSMHGLPAESFTLNDLRSDRPVLLDDLEDRVVVLNFWATWCGPCRAEMDALDELQQEWKEDGLVVLAVNQEELPADVQPYIEAEGYSFTVLLDRFGIVSLQYEVDEIPTTFVIDREGIIREHMIGARTEEDFRRAIERWLDK